MLSTFTMCYYYYIDVSTKRRIITSIHGTKCLLNYVSSVFLYSEFILRTTSFCPRWLNWHVYVSRLPMENSPIYLILIVYKMLLISTAPRLWILMLSLWLHRIYRLEWQNNRNNRYCRGKLSTVSTWENCQRCDYLDRFIRNVIAAENIILNTNLVCSLRMTLN